MEDSIECLKARAESCRKLAATALTDEGRTALEAMARDYAKRAEVVRPLARSQA